MKKKIIIILISVLLLIGIGFFLYTRDNFRFKFSYEMYNHEKLSGNKEINIHIPLKNKVNYLDEKELNKFLKNGTGLLYFGYSSCPWCRNIVPILIEVAKSNNMTINYVDTHSVSVKNAITVLNNYLRVNDEGDKVLAVPDVYVIKDGKVLSHHLGTLDSYNNPYEGMSNSQKEELKKIYEDMIKELK